jgi:hypothetical protein
MDGNHGSVRDDTTVLAGAGRQPERVDQVGQPGNCGPASLPSTR